MNDNTKESLTSAYLKCNMDALSILVDNVHNTLDTFLSYTFNQNALNNLSLAISDFIATYDILTKNIDFNGIYDITNEFLSLFSSITLPSYNLPSIVNNIRIESDYVYLTDETVEAFSDILANTNEDTLPCVDSKMSAKEFLISVILPIALFVLQLLYDDHQAKLNALEAERQQLKESAYQEAILNLEAQHVEEIKKLNSNITELLQYLESAQDSDLPDADIPVHSDEVQDSAPSFSSADCEFVDTSHNHDAY